MTKDNELKSKLKTLVNARAIQAICRWSGCVRKAVLAVCLINVLFSACGLAVTMATKGLVDSAVGASLDGLWRYGLLLAGLVIAQRLMSIWTMKLRNTAAARLQLEMQKTITVALLSRNYAELKHFHSGELVNRVFSDAAVVRDGVIYILPSLVRTAVSFIGAAVILITMDWRFVPVMLVAGILGVLVTALFKNPMKRRHKRMQEAEDALRSVTQETIENVGVIKASRSEERTIRQMNEYRQHLRDEQVRNGRLNIAMNSGMGSLFDLSWLLCNVWGCVKIYQGEFTYGSLAAMIQLVGRIEGPIANAVSLVGEIYGVVASAERMLDVIDLEEEVDLGDLNTFDSIRLEDVSFQYEDGNEKVLLGIDGEIRRGDFVALKGMSGAGKSSLFQLLLGIYRPTEGRVAFINGAESVEANRGTRRLFAYVPQGNMLFSGTLRDNLTRFTDTVTDAEIGRAVKAACIDDLVDEIGLDAVLGERGVGLSEGQAQRVAVARALLSGAPILLLDEATSALDEETEARLLRNISQMRDKTVLIVTHRRAALDICDVQWIIEHGQLRSVALHHQPRPADARNREEI